jgi:hypothetical protein
VSDPTRTEKFKAWDGRPLTEHEREILTVVAEECNEVAKECNTVAIKVSKLLRFGANQTNPVSLQNNSHELSEEVGDLSIVLERLMLLPEIFNSESYLEGRARKLVKLHRFLQHDKD